MKAQDYIDKAVEDLRAFKLGEEIIINEVDLAMMLNQYAADYYSHGHKEATEHALNEIGNDYYNAMKPIDMELKSKQ